MAATTSAREIARVEITRQITDAARRQLASEGASALSLRAVARELGMASSAVYRYFPSRNDLLTALIIEAYAGLGEAAERAHSRIPRADVADRWMATTRAVRRWAVAHPHEYALVYGSPVPGYRAPQDAVAAATRVVLLLAGILLDGAAAGALQPPRCLGAAKELLTPDTMAAASPGQAAANPELILRSLTAWSLIFGSVSFELFGHLHNAVTDYERYYDNAMAIAAEIVGLRIEI